MTEYLFLVPSYAEPDGGDWKNYEGWQQASFEGRPIKTTETGHFGGNMPLIRATEFMDYYSLEDHIEETVKKFKDEGAI